jgi:uncharacterized membrane protein YdbT with pleckstrin-like domain
MSEILFAARPSLRKAYYHSTMFSIGVLAARILTGLNPKLNPVWWLALGLVLIYLLAAVVLKRTTLFLITNDEIQHTSGVAARRSVVIPLSQVTNATAVQSVLQRSLGLVTLEIDTAGGDAIEMVFFNITKDESALAAKIIRDSRSRTAASSRERSEDIANV